MPPSDSASTQPITPSVLNIIRWALLGGVVIFGAAAWFVNQQANAPMLSGEVGGTIRWGLFAFFGGVAIGILVVKQKWTTAETFDAKRPLNIVGWALAESMALVGAVYFLLTSNPAFFLTGLLVQLFVSFMFLPVPASEG